jgi:hypothetical protein
MSCSRSDGGIRRCFCQIMGRDITVESESGRGLTFTIRLPRIVDAPQEGSDCQSGYTGSPDCELRVAAQCLLLTELGHWPDRAGA